MSACSQCIGVNTNTEELLSLNRDCDCLSLSRPLIDQQIAAAHRGSMLPTLLQARPHLFAHTAVFLGAADLAAMQAQVTAIEAVSRLPGYRSAIMARDPSLCRAQPGTNGLFMGYDFHLTSAGPRLIEVNTNAGGAFIVRALLDSLSQQLSPCDPAQIDSPEDIGQRIATAFLEEWRCANRLEQPQVIAIVDEQPTQQYLLPDMHLAQTLLAQMGIRVLIVDPTSLSISRGRLRHDNLAIDMVYNRLTDFELSASAHKVLRQALVEDLAVVSPSPLHHALFADKRNPILWRNPTLLARWGASSAQRQTLSDLPQTEAVDDAALESLWPRRKQLYFKPSSGYGGKAVYRGSKLTRRVWSNITNGGYVAQSLVPAALRTVELNGEQVQMKFDVRLYTYAGRVLLAAARIYQGQATNFRSAGGGFAPVIYID